MAKDSKNGNINKDMGKIISLHDRRSGVRFLVITEHIIAICDNRNDPLIKQGGEFAWTNIITTNRTFEVVETEQEILDKMA